MSCHRCPKAENEERVRKDALTEITRSMVACDAPDLTAELSREALEHGEALLSIIDHGLAPGMSFRCSRAEFFSHETRQRLSGRIWILFAKSGPRRRSPVFMTGCCGGFDLGKAR